MRDLVLGFLKKNEVEYLENHSIKDFSFVRIGGNAKFICFPSEERILTHLIDFLDDIKIQYKVLGRMSNVLPPDGFFDGVIVKTDRLDKHSIDDGAIFTSCGASVARLANFACANGLCGLEELSGIPGSIGASIIGNAGAFGREISDLVVSVSVYDHKSRAVISLDRDKLEFSYRDSILKRRDLAVLSAKLRLTRSDRLSIKSRMNEIRYKRLSTQPIGSPSLGSVFKRPSRDTSAALLIDRCGLKGKRIGGAVISEKHCGFILNDNNASAKDYLELCDLAADAVYGRFGISLEKEIEIM